MTTFKLQTPLSEKDIRQLKVNDVIFLDGVVITARDQAHKRALKLANEGKSLPVSFEGLALFHCGPVMAKRNQKWVPVATGPTTSMRMELFEDKFLKIFKPRIIIGKGGMGMKTTQEMQKCGAVYCAFTGGAAILAAKGIKNVSGVEWCDLGMAEAMWILQVESLGPLIVAIDSHGKNLFSDVAATASKNRDLIFQKFGF